MSSQTMLQLISAYLYRYGHCPLPGLGTLFMSTEPARVLHGEHKIAAPTQTIEFRTEHQPADRLISFISEIRNISYQEAKNYLESYCDNVKITVSGAEPGTRGPGHFHVDAEGELIFVPVKTNEAFHQDVKAERVVHPNESHQMLVGDRETTTTRMTEFYTESEPQRKSKWWIAALIIALLGIAMIVIYMQRRQSGIFGNSSSVEVKAAEPTYKQIP